MRQKSCFALIALIVSCLVVSCDDEARAIPQAFSTDDLVRDDDFASQRVSSASADNPDPTGPRPAASVAPFRYDREKARVYIERYAKKPNRKLAYCSLSDGTPADCTNFASQVLWYGGVPMEYSSSDDYGWWYRYSCIPTGSSKSWKQVNRLVTYLVTESGIGEFRRNARDLKVGDLIFYRLRREEDGYSCDGNLFNHSTIVSGFDDRGEPLVSYHSNDALHVPWDVKNGSRLSLGEACAVAFVHIRD